MGSQRLLRSLSGALLALTLAACGSGDSGEASLIDGGQNGGGPGGTPVTVRVGTLDAGSFQSGAVALGLTQLAAGGQTSVRVDIVDLQGARAQDAFTVSFSSECSIAGLATFTPDTVTASSGRFDATYVARGCSGADRITARVMVGEVILTAAATVTILPAELGSIQFISATPSVIGITGSPIGSQAVVVFQVFDNTGGPVRSTPVSFSLSSPVGGTLLNPTSATTDANGRVQTVVRAGSAQTVVRVIASTVNATSGITITSQSESLVISTGIPDQDSASISVERFSIEGNCDGQTNVITMRLADRYNNPVPEGTAVTFTAEGGSITAQCFTGDPLADGGSGCSVTQVVQNPRPSNGRVTVLSTGIGEESFTDSNGNGFFNSGEPFMDLGEAFLDLNENGVRDSIEPIIDANGNQSFDAADGQFTGYVCDSPGVNCRSRTVNVRQSTVVVFSTEDASLDGLSVFPSGGTYNATTRVLTLTQAEARASVLVTVRDTNGNPLPSGTTFTLTTDIGGISEPATVGPFNTNSPDPAANTFGYGFIGPDGDEDEFGVVSIQVVQPGSTCRGAQTETFGLFSVVYDAPAPPVAP